MSAFHAVSIVLETENLANGEFSDLQACLDSLQAQDLAAHGVTEVLLVESGQVAAEALATVTRAYPWVTVHVADTQLHYYEAKMRGVAVARGDVVVFADSDLVYEQGWLGALLEAIREGACFVTGETRVDITGPYSFAVATAWLFPRRFHDADAPSLTANNAAVSRAALVRVPFPAALPLYRGQVVVHGQMLRRLGFRIRRAAARGWHAPPAGIQEWALRFAVSGADSVRVATCTIDDEGRPVVRDTVLRRVRGLIRSNARKWVSTAVRTLDALVERPGRVRYLPIALPITIASLWLFGIGSLSAALGSRLAYRLMCAFERRQGGVRAAG